MKKLLGIVVLGLLWFNSASSSTFMWNYEKGYVRAYLESNDNIESEMNERVNKDILDGLNCQNGFDKTKEEMPSWVLQDSTFSKKGKLRKKYQPFRLYKITCLSSEQIKKNEQQELMFTINDKKDQCEAIGFTPKTDKFADCVLRLVELDVKKQTSDKIAAAQNAGNQAIANQLQKQRRADSSRYLLDLGQKLLQPNSSIYSPNTSRCRVNSFGNNYRVTCY